MKKTFREIIIIFIISLTAGLIVNAVSPKGIALVRDDSQRFVIDSSSSVSVNQRGKLDKQGFYQPVNIPVETAKKLFDEKAVFIDGREPDEFEQGHIQGAINIPYKDFKEKKVEEKQQLLKDIKKEQFIVSYCGSDSCEISIDNAYEMAKVGYSDVKIYLGGLKEWNKMGYPIKNN
ncbi:MAG: rhodanese-like domain-containing protein [bacterium]|nr:rhodanese-like domain-containing protein [bacterium]